MGRLANKPLCKPLYRLWESQTVRESNLECTVWVAHSRRRDFHHLRTHGTRCNRLHIARLSGLLNTNIILSFTIFGRFHCPASERSLHIDLEKREIHLLRCKFFPSRLSSFFGFLLADLDSDPIRPVHCVRHLSRGSYQMTADRCEVVNGPSERYHPAVTSQRTSGKWMLGNANGRRWISVGR